MKRTHERHWNLKESAIIQKSQVLVTLLGVVKSLVGSREIKRLEFQSLSTNRAQRNKQEITFTDEKPWLSWRVGVSAQEGQDCCVLSKCQNYSSAHLSEDHFLH